MPHAGIMSTLHSRTIDTGQFDLTFRPALVPEEGMTLDETNSKMLVDFLNSLFGYPHDGGLEYVRPAAE